MSKSHGAPRHPVVLIILDGFGTNPCKVNNAVVEAHTPRLDDYFSHHPHTLIQASGRAVGLPIGQMGNSEVGHMTLGAGTLVRQYLVQIDDAIGDRSFLRNEVLVQAAENAAADHRPLHLIGLLSDGGVHSHVRHLLALIDLCRRHQVRPVLHAITDGRDTPPRVAKNYFAQVEKALAAAGGSFATVSGRYFAMDRDNRWDRTELAWRAMALGQGERADTPEGAVDAAYDRGEDDEFIRPTVLSGAELIDEGAHVLFFNFRKDRPRQLSSALFQEDFERFDREGHGPVHLTCMTEYDHWWRVPFAFAQDRPRTTLAKVLSKAGLRQFHCAETEKYAHVTFFLNGGHGDPYPGEDREIVPSAQVATYDLQPEMSAPQVADEVIKALKEGTYAFVVVNFANGDMVGHTARREAILSAVEALDREVGRVLDVARAEGYSCVLTADHGNCDELLDPVTGAPQTQHSVYPVPLLVVDEVPWQLSGEGGLSNVAPTVLHLMGLPKPPEMTADSLLLGPVRA